MQFPNNFNPDNSFGGMPMALALSAVAKSGGQFPVHLPINSKDALYYGWMFENKSAQSKFGFWQAGITLIDPNTGETWLTVSFIPNAIGGIDIVHTEVKKTKIRKLSIRHKVESSGFSFGFFSMQKLEVKHYFNDWRQKVYEAKSTTMVRLDENGNVVDIPAETRPNLPEMAENEVNLRGSATDTDPIWNRVTCEEMAEYHTQYFPQVHEEAGVDGKLKDIDLLAAPVSVSRNDEPEPPGFYIKTGGQAGIPSLNMMEAYLVKEDGEIISITRNICTSVTYDTYRKKVTKSSSGSGPFKKKKIRIVIKALSRSLNACGDFGFSPKRFPPKPVKVV